MYQKINLPCNFVINGCSAKGSVGGFAIFAIKIWIGIGGTSPLLCPIMLLLHFIRFLYYFTLNNYRHNHLSKIASRWNDYQNGKHKLMPVLGVWYLISEPIVHASDFLCHLFDYFLYLEEKSSVIRTSLLLCVHIVSVSGVFSSIWFMYGCCPCAGCSFNVMTPHSRPLSVINRHCSTVTLMIQWAWQNTHKHTL